LEDSASPSPWPAAAKFQSDGHLTASAINQMAQLSELHEAVDAGRVRGAPPSGGDEN
jgi:hypothetical protein